MIQRLMTLALLLFASFQVAMASEAHFITDANYRSKVEKAFREKMALVGEKFFDVKDLRMERLMKTRRRRCASSMPTCQWLT